MPGLLETLVLDHLRPRGSGWWLPPLLMARLEEQLRAQFADPRLPNEDLIRLLKLIAVFEQDAAYRDVAEDLIDLLGRLPSAVSRIEGLRGRTVVNETRLRQLSTFVSCERIKRAPRIDEKRTGGLLLKDLLPNRATRPGG
jgi:hypothetical protein